MAILLNTEVKHKLLDVIANENNTVRLYKHSPNYTIVVRNNQHKKLFVYKHTQKDDTVTVNGDVLAIDFPHTLSANMRELNKALLNKWEEQEEKKKREIALATMTATEKQAIAFLDKYSYTK